MPTDRSQKREAALGLTAVAVLVLGLLLIFFMDDLRRLFIPTDTLHALMPSAAGLRTGAPVWIAGQTVGEIEEIQVRPPDVDSTQRVAVRFKIVRRYREHVRADSEVRITTFSMIGDPVLDITPGSPGAPPIEPNDTLRMRTGGTPAAAMNRAISLHESLQELLAESRVMATQARDRSAQARRMQTQLAATSREFRAFTLAVSEGPLTTLSDPEFKRIIGNLSTLIGELRASFTRAADRAQAARADAEPALRRLAARADTIAAQIDQLQQSITAGGGGLLIRAQTDSAIVKALHGAQVQMDSLMAETKRNPLRFWF